MTIDWLRVNLKGCFDSGQAYVACSRGKSLTSMTVKNFDIHEIKTSEKVKYFYKALSNDSNPYTPTWSDTIAEFDMKYRRRKKLMRFYKDRKCDVCGAQCVVRRVKKKNYNEGKLFVACPNGNSMERYHYFDWLPINRYQP